MLRTWSHADPPEPGVVADLLLRFTEQTAPPVSLSPVLEMWPDLAVSTEDLDGAGYLLDLGRAGGEIIIRAQDALPRRRYTLAHELGHWILGRDCSPSAGAATGEPDVSGDHRLGQRALIERWCDGFAAALLMPVDFLRDEIVGTATVLLPGRLLEMPGEYLVSRQALWIRASEVVPIALLHWRPGRPPKILGEFSNSTIRAHSRVAFVRWALSTTLPTVRPDLASIEGLEVAMIRMPEQNTRLACARPGRGLGPAA